MPQHWAILRIKPSTSGFVAQVELDDGTVIKGDEQLIDLPVEFRPGRVTTVPVGVPRVAVETLGRLAEASQRWSLPVFVDPPDELSGLSWEPALRRLLERLKPEGWRGLRLAHGRPWRVATRPSAPLEVLVADGIDMRALQLPLHDDDLRVRSFRPGGLEDALAQRLTNVVVISDFDAASVVDAVRASPVPPGLLVGAAQGDDPVPGLRTAQLAPASSLTVVSQHDVGSLIRGILDDQPLHVAAPLAPVLVSDPAADHALRLTGGAGRPRFTFDVRQLELPQRVDLLRRAAGEAMNEDVTDRLIDAASEVARTGNIDPPITRMRDDPKAAQALARAHRRGADVRLRDVDGRFVSRQSGIEPGARYTLEIQIGRRDPKRSLLTKSAPPIDPLLPKTGK